MIHTIISSFSADLGSPIAAPPVRAIAYIRNHLLPSPGTDEIPKLTLQRIITAGLETIATQVWKTFRIEFDHTLTREIHHFYTFLRPRIAQRMRDAGFIGCDNPDTINRRNILYFPCEAAETAIMTGALETLLHLQDISSLVWLHDGMYVNQEVEPSIVQRAIYDSATECEISNVRIKITHCSEAFRELGQHDRRPIDPSALSIAQQIQNIGNERQGPAFGAESHTIALDEPLGRLRANFRSSSYKL